MPGADMYADCERPRHESVVAAFVILVASNVSALAWGYEGHRIVAEIAEQFLEPETAHRVRDLLAIENLTTLAEVSTLGRRNSTAGID